MTSRDSGARPSTCNTLSPARGIRGLMTAEAMCERIAALIEYHGIADAALHAPAYIQAVTHNVPGLVCASAVLGEDLLCKLIDGGFHVDVVAGAFGTQVLTASKPRYREAARKVAMSLLRSRGTTVSVVALRRLIGDAKRQMDSHIASNRARDQERERARRQTLRETFGIHGRGRRG